RTPEGQRDRSGGYSCQKDDVRNKHSSPPPATIEFRLQLFDAARGPSRQGSKKRASVWAVPNAKQWSADPQLRRHLCGVAAALYSSVYLALMRVGFATCVFMWAALGFDPKPTVRQIRATPL